MAPSCIPNEIRDRLDSVSNVLDIDASNDHIISVRKALRMLETYRDARKARQNDIAIVMAIRSRM
jgi:hypothetical protein